MDFQAIWDDDMASFIAFLVVILPLPFVYSIVQNIPGYSSHVRIAGVTFLSVAVLWLAVAILYHVFFLKGSSEEEVAGGSI